MNPREAMESYMKHAEELFFFFPELLYVGSKKLPDAHWLQNTFIMKLHRKIYRIQTVHFFMLQLPRFNFQSNCLRLFPHD